MDVLFSSKKHDWETPDRLFNKLNEEFNFTLDAAASDSNAKLGRYYTVEDNALEKSWAGEVVFCNPPYGRKIGKWVEKCYTESQHATIVLLIPSRTDTAYFHNYIYGKAEIRFLRGRIKFENNGVAQNSAPFPSLLAIYRNDLKPCPFCGKEAGIYKMRLAGREEPVHDIKCDSCGAIIGQRQRYTEEQARRHWNTRV